MPEETLSNPSGDAADPAPSEPIPSSLDDAWNLFSLLDDNAGKAQNGFVGLRSWILGLGVLATALAVTYSWRWGEVGKRPDFGEWKYYLWLLVVATPIVTSILLAGAARLGSGRHWIGLRSGAEAIKREIYRYRTRAGAYATAACRDEVLADKVGEVARQMLESETIQAGLSRSASPPWLTEGDDGRSDLDAEQYLGFRLDDQVRFYRLRTDQFRVRHRRFTWATIVFGGVGTALAAIGWEIWVPVAVTLAAAFTGFLELKGTEERISTYTGAALELDVVRIWWHAQSPDFRAGDAGRRELVDKTELILERETGGWRKQMEKTLGEIQAAQAKATAGDSADTSSTDEPTPGN